MCPRLSHPSDLCSSGHCSSEALDSGRESGGGASPPAARYEAYLHYVDDFILFADDTATLWTWHKAIVERLARLRVILHPGAHPRPVTEGLPFLGSVVYPSRRRLKQRKGIHFVSELRRMSDDYTTCEIGFDATTASVRGWVNHTRYANITGLRAAILSATLPRPR